MEIGRARQILTADEIFDLVREDLDGVEKAIGIESFPSADTVTPISKHLQQNGGERLRAAVLLLCARAAGGDGGRMAIQLGAVVEMLHTAALVHNGMMDVERSLGTWHSAHVQPEDCASVLAGDWLYLRAFRVALEERVLDLAIGAAQMMVMAQFTQLNRMGNIAITEADCIEMSDRKTAALFSACGRLGAVSAGADSHDGQQLGEFAWNLGMSFQLIDDMLDFAADERMRAKPAGSDLRGGNVTLPLVYALEQATAAERNLVAEVLGGRTYEAVPFASILAVVNRYGGMELTRARARQFNDRARQIAAGFPDSLSRRALIALTDLVMERDC